MVTKQFLNLFVTIPVSLDIFRQNKTALYNIIFTLNYDIINPAAIYPTKVIAVTIPIYGSCATA